MDSIKSVENANNKRNEEGVWYKKTAWIVFFLFVCSPLGIFLMWKYLKWNYFLKITITGLLAFIIISNFFFPIFKKSNKNTQSVISTIITPTLVPTITPTPTIISKVLSVQDFKGKKYSELDGILGASKQIQQPNGSVVGIKHWNIQNLEIEATYYNLSDPVQVLTINPNRNITLKSSELFKMVGLDKMSAAPDKITSVQKQWNNIDGIYKVIYTSGSYGSSSLTILFYCLPDTLNVCKYL